MSTDMTTTSYAILGLLAIRSWTTYELAQQMDRTFRHFWPRAKSKVYEEPKKLVALGLAQARAETVGRRPRTTYVITPEGRRVLSAWLAKPGEGPVLESEQFVKLFFAEFGSKQDVLRTLRAAREWAAARTAEHAAVAQGYLAGVGPFPRRLAVHSLNGRFLADFATLVASWADWATDVVDAWPEDISRAEPDWAALEDIAERELPSPRPAEPSPA